MKQPIRFTPIFHMACVIVLMFVVPQCHTSCSASTCNACVPIPGCSWCDGTNNCRSVTSNPGGTCGYWALSPGQCSCTCSAGQYCTTCSPCGGVLTCPAGKYCAAGTCTAVTCTTCGKYCPAGSAAEVLCPGGSYCTAGSSAPTTCPAGSYCPAGACIPTSCVCGVYCPAGSASPVNCPGGSYCPASSSAATPCPGGSYCAAGACTPTTCVCGTYCPASLASPVNCPVGYYCGAAVAAAVHCPAGFFCPAAVCVPIVCPVGFYCPLKSTVAIQCQQDHYCSRAGMWQPSVTPSASSQRSLTRTMSVSMFLTASLSASAEGSASRSVSSSRHSLTRSIPSLSVPVTSTCSTETSVSRSAQSRTGSRSASLTGSTSVSRSRPSVSFQASPSYSSSRTLSWSAAVTLTRPSLSRSFTATSTLPTRSPSVSAHSPSHSSSSTQSLTFSTTNSSSASATLTSSTTQSGSLSMTQTTVTPQPLLSSSVSLSMSPAAESFSVSTSPSSSNSYTTTDCGVPFSNVVFETPDVPPNSTLVTVGSLDRMGEWSRTVFSGGTISSPVAPLSIEGQCRRDSDLCVVPAVGGSFVSTTGVLWDVELSVLVRKSGRSLNAPIVTFVTTDAAWEVAGVTLVVGGTQSAALPFEITPLRVCSLVNVSTAACRVAPMGRPGSSLWALVLYPPHEDGRWPLNAVSLRAQYLQFVIILRCSGERRVAAVYTTVLPQAGLVSETTVQAVVGGALIVSALGGSMGSSVAQLSVVRRMMLCSENANDDGDGVGGGLLGISLQGVGGKPALSAARGAVVGNSGLLVGFAVFLCVAVCAIHAFIVGGCVGCVQSSGGVLSRLVVGRRMHLPSAYFPLFIQVVPTLASSATSLLWEADAAVDIGMGIIGMTMCCVYLGLLLRMWWLLRRAAPVFHPLPIRREETAASRKRHGIVSDDAACRRRRTDNSTTRWRRLPGVALLVDALEKRFKWSPSSHPYAQYFHVAVSESRFGWFCVLDGAMCFINGVLAGIPAVGTTSVCVSLITLVMLSFIVMIIAVVRFRPYTTQFGNVYNAVTFMLCILVMALQIAVAVDPTLEWAMLGALGCMLAVLGLAFLKFLMDLLEVLKGLRRFVRWILSQRALQLQRTSMLTLHHLNTGALPLPPLPHTEMQKVDDPFEVSSSGGSSESVVSLAPLCDVDMHTFAPPCSRETPTVTTPLQTSQHGDRTPLNLSFATKWAVVDLLKVQPGGTRRDSDSAACSDSDNAATGPFSFVQKHQTATTAVVSPLLLSTENAEFAVELQQTSFAAAVGTASPISSLAVAILQRARSDCDDDSVASATFASQYSREK